MAAGLGTEEVWQCQVQLSSPLPAPGTPSEGPNSTNPQTGDLLWSTKWPCCVVDGKGLEKVTKLEQFSSPYVLKFFWSFLGKQAEKSGDSRRRNTFLQFSFPFPTYVDFFDTSTVSASGPVAYTVLTMHTQTPVLWCCVPTTVVFCAGPNAFLLTFLRFINLLLQNMISQCTSPICSWLESALVHLSCLLNIKIKNEPYLCQTMEYLLFIAYYFF